MADKIIIASSVITAVTVIVSCAITCYKIVKHIDEWKDRMERHDRDNYLNILRLIIMNDNMPLEERIAAGDKYIAEGGNGAVKHHYQELIKKLK